MRKSTRFVLISAIWTALEIWGVGATVQRFFAPLFLSLCPVATLERT